MKQLSIVFCTYNGKKHIREAVEAVLKQDSFDNYVDQILIVDNASNDGTTQLCKELAETYDKVSYVYEETPGLSFARRHAASVKTDWVTYLDDDNVVMDGWLQSTIAFIHAHPNLGVCNCASIAMPEEKLTQEQQDTLHAIAPGIACTHVSLADFTNKAAPRIHGPFGAGMTLRVAPLRQYLSDGWTRSVGRTKSSLSSGEDGEIARAVLRQGYEYKYNGDTGLLHLIPLSRLQPEYIKRLTDGLDRGSYQYISSARHYVLYRIGVLVKYGCRVMTYPLEMMALKSGRERKRRELLYLSHKNIIRLIVKNGVLKKC